jgi:magnesium transporter
MVRRVLVLLNPNQAAALLARLSEEERGRCLETLEQELAEELRELSAYPRDTAGGLMDPRVTSFRPDASVRDVVRRIRRFRDRKISDIFLVDEDSKLLGAVTLQDVVLSSPDTPLSSLIEEGVPSVQAVASCEEVVQTFQGGRLQSLPVVDFEGRLLGVLRHRELMQVAQERSTASAVTMVGASEDERALSSPFFAVRKRLPWLEINLLTAFLAAAVVGVFEDTIAALPALAVLLPVVAGQSGNTGAQALAVTIRGLALREIRTRHWWKVVTKEIIAGAGNGVVVALTTAVAVYFWSGSSGLALVICVSMVISMTIAGLAGAAIPMVLTSLRQDPAQSSSIFLTTVTDVAGFYSFLGIATLLSAMI